MLANHTRNQPFVGGVEQKVNAANPQAADRNLRISSFRLIDRKGYQLECWSWKAGMAGRLTIACPSSTCSASTYLAIATYE